MKKVMITFLVFALLLNGIVAAQPDDYNNFGFVESRMSIGATIDAQYGPDPYLEYFNVKARIRPLNDAPKQVVKNEEYNLFPENAEKSSADKALLFTWRQQTPEKFSFEILSDVVVFNDIIKVRDKINFPPENIPDDAQRFTHETTFIDINPEIQAQANEIVEGETDYYRAVFALAQWVESNINYTLDTMTEDAVQRSSWVLENKYGVCDELTNLFISMVRSVGIPARFISGQAYSNVINDFGNHGWAEVYFPGYGWLPFDITFNQLGWTDPSHIKFSEQLDSGEPAVEYSWKSRETNFQKSDIKIKTNVLKTGESAERKIDLTVEMLYNNVGAGSYVPILATVKNLNDYYVPVFVFLKKAPHIIGKNVQTVLLGPREEQNIIWIVKTIEEADPDYVYISSIEVDSPYGDKAVTNLTYSINYEKISKEKAEEEARKLSPIPKKELIPGLEFDCSFSKDFFYEEEKITASCKLENSGNTRFDSIRVCLENNCERIELAIKNIATVPLEAAPYSMDSGKKRFLVETSSLVKYDFEDLRIIGDPQLVLISSEPSIVVYGKEVNLTLHTKSKKKAFNVMAEVIKGGRAEIGDLEGENKIVLDLDTRDINSNKVIVKLAYEDETGRKFTAAEKDVMEIIKRPWYASFLYSIRNTIFNLS